MANKVATQIDNIAALRGIELAAYAMPDAHWAYGFPIGGVAAFDPECGGIISAGGVGFDISCGVRALTTDLNLESARSHRNKLTNALFEGIPAGIHCVSRGPGHRIGTEYLRQMVIDAHGFGIDLPDQELVCVAIKPPTGEKYLGVMRSVINCALAN